MKLLEEKLISISENDYGMVFLDDKSIEEDPYAENILNHGELFCPEKLFCLDMPLGQCHQNVANVFKNNENQDGDRLFTGYTQQYSGGGWMQHSWIVDKDGFVVESTSRDDYPQYFGIELKGENLDVFLDIWCDEALKEKSSIKEFLNNKIIISESEIAELKEDVLNLYFDEDDFQAHLDNKINELKNMEDKVKLNRVIFVNDLKDINLNELGKHWTMDKSTFDSEFLNYLKYECNGEEIKGKPFIISATFDKSDIDYKMTINQYMLNPNENEIFIKKNNAHQTINEIFEIDMNGNKVQNNKNKKIKP